MTVSVVLIVISIATLIVGWAGGSDPTIYVSIVTAALALVMLVASYLRERRMRVQPSAGVVAPPPSLEPSVIPEPLIMPPPAAGFADEDEEEGEPVPGRTFSMVAKPASPRTRSKAAAKPKAKAKNKTAAKPKAKAKAKAAAKPKTAAKPKAKAAAKPKAKAKPKPKAAARLRAR